MRKPPYTNKMYYFSEKLRRKLDHISEYPLTVVEAPSGFGKTTAVREHLKKMVSHGAREYWYTCMGESASQAWREICELLSNATAKVADDLNNLKLPTMDTLFYMAAYLRNFQCQTEIYLVVDNYQLVNSDIPWELLNIFSMHGCPCLHMIFITQQLGAMQRLSVYNNYNIHTIDAGALFFDREGTAGLFHMEGIRLSSGELEKVFRSTEGWVSAIRLQLINYQETGSFDFTADIEHLVENAIWKRLAPGEKDFLLSVSVFDSFTDRQASIMLNQRMLPEEIEYLLKTNDFIRYQPDQCRYSIHSIFQDYLRNRFYHHQPRDYQEQVFRKAGQACVEASLYYPAAKFFYEIRDYEAILSMPFHCEYFTNQKENNRLELIEAMIRECPKELLCRYPYTLLTFGYWSFLRGLPELFRKLCNLLQEIILTGEGMEEEERRKIKGEFLLLLSVYECNDLSKMLEYQKQAWDSMEKASELLKLNLPWVFAAASPLNIFWSKSGELEKEIQQLEDGRERYLKLTGGHGAGIASVMRAEAMLMRGEDNEAEILCHRALYSARSHNQTGVCLSAELVLAQIALLRGDALGYLTVINNIRDYAIRNSSPYVVRMVELCMSKISLSLGIEDYVASWLYDMERLKNILHEPAVSHAQLLHLELLLMGKRYHEFYGVSGYLSDTADTLRERVPLMMPKENHLICLAIAKLNSGNQTEAQEYLNQALSLSLPDKIYLPVARHRNLLAPLLENSKYLKTDREGMHALTALGKRYEKGAAAIRKMIIAGRSTLTPREREIARLAKDRLSAREIADKLCLSETTVRTVLKNIYSKLDIHSKYELIYKEF